MEQKVATALKLTKPAPLTPNHKVVGFDCDNQAMNTWLTKWALAAKTARTANTFVVCRGRTVVGYYSLATATIAHDESTSKLRRNSPDPVPAMLLARLAVAKSEQGNGIGPALVQDAMRRTLTASRHVAARTLLVHAIDEKAVAFYKKIGFIPLPNKNDGLTTLHLPIDTIAKSLP